MSPIRIEKICLVVVDGLKAQLLPIQSTKNIWDASRKREKREAENILKSRREKQKLL